MSKLVCWKCGGSLDAVSLPLRRLEECPACNAELHVCLMCEFYDISVADACREPIAEQVRNKKHANFCDYFKPRPGAYDPVDAQRQAAERDLQSLFGDAAETPADADSAQRQLEDLFVKPEKK